MNVWLFLGLGGVALVGIWIWGMVYRPILQLRRLLRDLAEGRKSTGFVARGAWGLEAAIVDLEKVSQRLEGISSKEETERFSLQAILGSLSEGVIVTDSEGKITLANRQLRGMFGLEESPEGRSVMEAVRQVEVAKAVEETGRDGLMRNLEINISSGDGGLGQTLAVNLAPVREKSGDQSGVVTVFYDLSKIRRLETVRQEFVANLSHELRTPLSIVAGYLETMEDLTLLKGLEGKKTLKILQRNCERLTLLVSDLLELSRIESGQVEMRPLARKPKEILEEVKEDWNRAFQGKGVKLALDCAEGLSEVLSDPLRTGQIFANLLENALRFAPEGSRVILGARQAVNSEVVEFFVADEGEGIPAEKLGRIFERFFRVDEGRNREKGGTGLGLSIVKHLVQLHGGEVRAESQEGKGTRVLFTKAKV